MIVVIGGGAAGLAAGIFARRANPEARVVVLDATAVPGAKILVSGGARCNVTNAVVTERDFSGGSPAVIRRVLRRWSVADTVQLFAELGVSLHEEHDGKLFPNSHRARDVRDALVAGLARAGAELRSRHRVQAVTHVADRFVVETAEGRLDADAVVLCTGGLSLPKTGSDGTGYRIATALGHTIVPTTPALVPLRLRAPDPASGSATMADACGGLSGTSHQAVLRVSTAAGRGHASTGSVLWTHFGISGPVALDISRHWLGAQLAGAAPVLTMNVCPEETFETVDTALVAHGRLGPRASVSRAVERWVPSRVADAAVLQAGLAADLRLSELTRDARRALVHRLVAWPLDVLDSRGYNFAEATAGGVPLNEVDPGTLQSRCCRGLYLAGEILDVDGRLGGFNFQWAWASAFVAGTAAGKGEEPLATRL